MSGIIAGIGFRMIAGKVLGKAASVGGSALKWLGGLDLLHVVLLVLVLFGAWQTGGRWVQHRHTAKVEAQLTSATNAVAKARKQLATSQANEATLKVALARQNTAVAALGATSTKQQNETAKAAQAAQERAQGAEAVAERLRRSSRSTALKSAPAAPCEPSDTLKGQWQ